MSYKSEFKNGVYKVYTEHNLDKSPIFIEIIDNNYNLPFILVKRLYSNYHTGSHKVNQNILKSYNYQYLGCNKKVVRILYGIE